MLRLSEGGREGRRIEGRALGGTPGEEPPPTGWGGGAGLVLAAMR